MADPVADPAALPIVPCPDCGRNVVTYVARRRQNAGQRFYKCRNHNPSAGGCDFYRWQQGYAAHLANLEGGEAAVGQIGPGQMQGGQAVQAQVVQALHGQPVQQNGPPEASQAASFASAVAGYMLAAAPVAGRQGVTVADAASINLVVSVANLVIGVAILLLLVADVVLRVVN